VAASAGRADDGLPPEVLLILIDSISPKPFKPEIIRDDEI
jgi:hypothetical protein